MHIKLYNNSYPYPNINSLVKMEFILWEMATEECINFYIIIKKKDNPKNCLIAYLEQNSKFLRNIAWQSNICL